MQLSEFINKLDKINFTAVDGKTLIGDILGQSAEVTLDIKLTESVTGLVPPLQAVFRVRMNGEHVSSWGSESNDSNAEMVAWFLTKKSAVERAEWDVKRQTQTTGQAIFNSL
jgi:hypothetical protein